MPQNVNDESCSADTRAVLNWFRATCFTVIGALGVSAWQPRVGDLLIGVVHTASIEPVGTLMEGRWWFDNDERLDQDQHQRLLESIGASPAQWLPFGRSLPARWEAHMADGRVVPTRVAGTLQAVGDLEDHLVVSIDRRTASKAQRNSLDVEGIALVGDATMGWFTDLEKPVAEQIRRTFASALVRAERAEMAARAAASDDSSARKSAGLSSRDLAALPFEIITARTASQRDGVRVYLVEGVRHLSSRDDQCTATHSGIAVRRDQSGSMTELGAWSYLVCNELWVEHVPLAWIARGDRTCWVAEYQYEDGIHFTVSTPAHPDVKGKCSIR
jgi:hypothetical protein